MYGLKKNIKRIITLILAFALALTVFPGCSGSGKDKKTVSLTISTTKETAGIITAMAEAFNNKTDGVKVSVKVYSTEDEKNYFLTHYEDKSELITFDYAQEALYKSEYLLKFDRMSVINRYSVSIINYLRDSEGSAYVLPSNGRYYTRVYNKDALASYGLSIPQTISELLTFSARLKESASAGYYASATLGGNDSILFALMSVAYPLFLNTVKGTMFLSGVVTGKLSFSDQEYKEAWREVFEYLKLLYDNGFYSLSSINKTAEEELEYFRSGEASAKQNDGSVSLKELFGSINGECAPFVGKTARDACIGSAPLFYLSLTHNAGASLETRLATKEFLSFFASAEGQSFITDYFGNDEYVSYLKGENVSSEVYKPVENLKNTGMLFINDSFNYAFGYCVNDIYDFLNSRLSIDSLLTVMDEKIKDGHNSEFTKITEIAKTYKFSDEVYKKNTELGTFFISALAESSYLDGAVMPSSYIKCSLIKGSLTERDLDAVFPEKNFVFAELTANDFIKIVSDISKDSYPLVYGITVKDGKLYKKNGKKYNDDEMIYTLIPADNKSVLSDSASLGSEVSSDTLLFSYFGGKRIITR